MSLGERDRLLYRLRAATFGHALECESECPSCALDIDFTLDLREILARVPSAPGTPQSTTLGEWQVTFRLPNSADMAAAGRSANVESAKATLLLR